MAKMTEQEIEIAAGVATEWLVSMNDRFVQWNVDQPLLPEDISRYNYRQQLRRRFWRTKRHFLSQVNRHQNTSAFATSPLKDTHTADDWDENWDAIRNAMIQSGRVGQDWPGRLYSLSSWDRMISLIERHLKEGTSEGQRARITYIWERAERLLQSKIKNCILDVLLTEPDTGWTETLLNLRWVWKTMKEEPLPKARAAVLLAEISLARENAPDYETFIASWIQERGIPQAITQNVDASSIEDLDGFFEAYRKYRKF